MASKALQNARYGTESMDENVIDVIGEDGTAANSYRQERAYGTRRHAGMSRPIDARRAECCKPTQRCTPILGAVPKPRKRPEITCFKIGGKFP